VYYVEKELKKKEEEKEDTSIKIMKRYRNLFFFEVDD